MGRAKKFFQKVGSFVTDQFVTTQHGNDGNNTIDGHNLVLNKLYGEGGDDKLSAFGARNELYGGTGNDTLRATGASNKLDGGDGDDLMMGLGLRNSMNGGAGDDVMQGYGAWNDMDGGEGNDHLIGLGAYNRMKGGAGDDRIEGIGAYNDMDGGEGNDQLFGLGAYNRMNGGEGDDVLTGLGAYNAMDAGAGNDHLFGLGAYNRMNAGEGNDTIEAIGAVNEVDAGAGDDVIVALGGVNVLNGGTGNDIITAVGGVNTISAGEGNDMLLALGQANFIDGDDGNDMMIGVGGLNSINGNAGDDILVSVGGGNVLDGGEGNDLLIGVGLASSQQGGEGDDILIGVSVGNLQEGGDGDDLIFAAGEGNFQFGDAGNDIMVALALQGGSSQHGGEGDDMLFARSNFNVQHGDDGNDLMVASGTLGNLQFGDAGNDKMFAASTLNVQHGGAGDDLMAAYGTQLNVQIGDEGNDTLISVSNRNVQLAGADDDMLIAYGNTNIQHGGSGDDIILSHGSHNLQMGAAGADVMIGSGAANLQFGGTLADLSIPFEAAGETFELPDIDVVGMFNDHVTHVEADNASNILVGGGHTNLQVGGAGDDFGIGLGKFNIQMFGDGDDVAVAGGEKTLQLGGEGSDVMISAQHAKKEGGSVQHGGADGDVMITYLDMVGADSAPKGFQFGDDGDDVMAMISTDFRYGDFSGVKDAGSFGDAVFVDGATFQIGGGGDDVMISAVADIAIRSGGEGDDTFVNLLEGGFASGGDGSDLMVSGWIPTSLYTGGDDGDVMMDFASWMRIAFGASGDLADKATGEVETLTAIIGGDFAQADLFGYDLDGINAVLGKIGDVAAFVEGFNPLGMISELATQFVTTFVLPTGNTFIGGEGDDVFGIASEITTAIGGAGDDTYVVHLDAVTDVSLSDAGELAEVADVARRALDRLDEIESGQTSGLSVAGGRDVADLRGADIRTGDLTFQRIGSDLMVTIATAIGIKTLTFAAMDDAEGRVELLQFGAETSTRIDLGAAFDAGLFGEGETDEAGLPLDTPVTFDASFAPFTTEGAEIVTEDGSALETFLEARTDDIVAGFEAVKEGFEAFIEQGAEAIARVLGVEIAETPDLPEEAPEITDEQQALIDENRDRTPEAEIGTVEATFETGDVIDLETLGDVAAFVSSAQGVVAHDTKTLALSDGNVLVLYGVEDEGGKGAVQGQLLNQNGEPVSQVIDFVTSGADMASWDARVIDGNRLAILADNGTMEEQGFIFTSGGEVYRTGTLSTSLNFKANMVGATATNGNTAFVSNAEGMGVANGRYTLQVNGPNGESLLTTSPGHGKRHNSDANIVGLATGGFAMVHTENYYGDKDLILSILDANGNAVHDYLRIADAKNDVSNVHTDAQLAALDDGSFLIIYTDGDATPGLRGLRVSDEGQVISDSHHFTTKVAGATAPNGSFLIQSGAVDDVSATTLADGRVAISWVEEDGTVRTTIKTFELDFEGGDGDEIFEGGVSDDVADGGAGADALFGSAGEDTLDGGEGDDLLNGGSGDDVLNGGAGADLLIGASGDDIMTGGTGADTFVFSTSDGAAFGQDTIADFDVFEDVIDLLGLNSVASIADLDIRQEGADAVVAIGEDSITLQGVDAGTLGSGNFATADNTVGERGTVELTHDAVTVELLGDYDNPVVVAFVKTANGLEMVETRVDNVTGSSFDIRLQETEGSDGIHKVETVSYMVVEAGRHELANGAVIEAGLVETDRVYQSTLNQGMTDVAFEGALSGADTRIFATLNTMNDAEFATARIHKVTAEGFRLSMAEREADTSGHGIETIGYVAFQNGDFGDFATGAVQLNHQKLQLTDAVADEFDFAQITQIGGNDPAVIRQDFDAGQIYLQEEQTYDAEVEHLYDTASFIDFQNDDGLFLI
ncbi:calcium-binding protein [Pseudooceanicola nanhaiensis]|uniref:calcium-binding protein n=1 Tax=Pseudooceanicola nanhaiensis TaxID=375761 RepID=UPI001CD3BDDE|nr:calcium-binding protein [Pseudooceanicola nanhaiensis]MCA0920672.1 hypothetical protein [Pseudooceanicola nanhaiensis]